MGSENTRESQLKPKGFDEEECEPKEKDFEMRGGIYHMMNDGTDLLQKPDFDQLNDRQTGFNQFSRTLPIL